MEGGKGETVEQWNGGSVGKEERWNRAMEEQGKRSGQRDGGMEGRENGRSTEKKERWNGGREGQGKYLDRGTVKWGKRGTEEG